MATALARGAGLLLPLSSALLLASSEARRVFRS
jgi:hypothetical protein